MNQALSAAIALLVLLAACGPGRRPDATPVQTPIPPFGMPNVGESINILAPFDTTTGQFTPSNLNAPIGIMAGNVTVTWSAVEDADGYLVVAADATAVIDAGGSEFSTALWHWSDAPAATLNMGAPGRRLLLQVFAYRGVDVLGQSAVWTLETGG